MKYNVVELSSGLKHIIVDFLEYENTMYFLLGNLSKDEEYIDKELKICLYSSDEKCFKEVVNEDYNILKDLFEERLDNQSKIIELLENINYNNIVKVIDINGYKYTLEDEYNNIIFKNIEFIGFQIPINSIIYIDNKIIRENNIYTYGEIYNYNKLNNEEIIKIICNDEEIYLQRYYG